MTKRKRESESVDQLVVGIDWSGAKKAGRAIWIAQGIASERCVLFTSIQSAAELPGSNALRSKCLPILTNNLESLIPQSGHLLVGLDCAMSVAKCLQRSNESWENWVIDFCEEFKTPEEFREKCRELSEGKEPKRRTDELTKTPFAPQNLRNHEVQFGFKQKNI